MSNVQISAISKISDLDDDVNNGVLVRRRLRDAQTTVISDNLLLRGVDEVEHHVEK